MLKQAILVIDGSGSQIPLYIDGDGQLRIGVQSFIEYESDSEGGIMIDENKWPVYTQDSAGNKKIAPLVLYFESSRLGTNLPAWVGAATIQYQQFGFGASEYNT